MAAITSTSANCDTTPGKTIMPLGTSSEGPQIIKEGLGTRLLRTTFLSRPAVAKQRIDSSKANAGHPATASVCKSEIRSMARARKMGLRTPVVYLVDHEANTIYMELIQGKTLKELLAEVECEDEVATAVLGRVGQAFAIMHDGGLVHKNLTTSSVMIEGTEKKVVMMDFAMASNSVIPHEKAADLYDFERSFLTSHPDKKHLYTEVFLEAYRKRTRTWIPTSKKLAEVRARDRKRKADDA